MIYMIIDGSVMQLKDRENASEILYSLLKDKLKNVNSDKYLVLGIPSGGVVMGDIIATKFRYSFDIVIPRRLVSPYDEELSIGAIMKDNTLYTNSLTMRNLKITDHYLNEEKERQLNEIKKREIILGQQIKEEKISGKNIILVDDGVATGATLIVASRWIRKHNPKNLTIATPVCPKYILKLLKEEADDIESIITPSSKNFTTVEKFYKYFEQLEIEKIHEIVKKYNLN